VIAGSRATARRGFWYDRDRFAAILAADCDEISETGLLWHIASLPVQTPMRDLTRIRPSRASAKIGPENFWLDAFR
jgi:hypothetical protein